jgi:very-short-patch-repair endonuclease
MLCGSNALSGEAPRPLRPSGAPSRSGEDLGRTRHRTLGADPKNIVAARKLRNEMSLPEVLLWRELRGKPQALKFRRQYPVLGYVADFACVEVRLLIEIDGIVHDMGDRPQHDEQRNGILMNKAWQVLRVAAEDVLADVKASAASIVALAESLRPLRHAYGAPPPRSGEDFS